MVNKKLFIWVGLTFIVASLYPASILIKLGNDGTRWIQNDPAYSFFVLLMLPLAVGVFMRSFNLDAFKRFAKQTRIILLIILFTMNLFAIMFGWQEIFRGPMLPPIMLRNPNDTVWIDRCLRDCIYEIQKNNSSNCDIKKYLSTLTQSQADTINLSTANASKIYLKAAGMAMPFKSLSDLLNRGSFTAYVSSFFNLVCGIFVMWVLWYIVILVIAKDNSPPAEKDNLLIVYSLLLLWFPTRIYSEWYINFYSISHFRAYYAFWFLLTLAVLVIPLLLLMLKPRRPVALFTTFHAIAIALFGLVNHFKPEWINSIAHGFENMPFLYFSAFILLISVLFSVMVFSMIPSSNQYCQNCSINT